MKIYCAILGMCVSVAAWAEDMTTVTGQTYSNIVVQRYDRQGITIRSDTGSTNVPFKEILPELREHYKTMALDLTSAMKTPGAIEEPAGPNDLTTWSGQVYRNVVVKEAAERSIRIAHDSGTTRVFFSEIPAELREKYHPGMPVVPDPPLGTNDLLDLNGQIFRHIEVLRTEPDGLTFRHDGGVTKQRFLLLPETVQQQYNFDPIAARQYQLAASAEKKRILDEQAANPAQQINPNAPATIAVFELQTDKPAADEFRVRFRIKNLTDQPQAIKAVPCLKNIALIGGNLIPIPAGAEGKLMEVLVPATQPDLLRVTCGAYQTNCILSW